MANPLIAPLVPPPSRREAPPAPPSDALYQRLIRAAATSRDRDSFLRQHQADLAQLAPQLRQVVVRSAGLGVPADTVAQALDPNSYLNRQIKLGVETLGGVSGGIVHTLGAVKGDVGSTIHGKPTISRSLKVGKETLKGTLESIEHPGRNLLGTALTAGALFTAGGGAVGRLGAISDVARGGAAANLTEAVGRLSKADARAYDILRDATNPAKLAGIDAPTAARLRNPSPQLQDVLRHDPHTQVAHQYISSQLHHFTPRRGGVGSVAREAGATKTARVMQAAIRTPRPKQRTLVVPGPQGRPAIVTHPLPSKNPLANIVERKLIDPRRQKKLDRRGLLPGARGIVESHSWLRSHEGAAAVRDVLTAIEQTHGTRAIQERAALFSRDRLLGGALGHRVGRQGRPVEIEFQRNQPGLHYVMTHEVGHAIKDTLPTGADQAVIDAAKASRAMQPYFAMQPGALRNYVTKDHELFARAYAQYVAEKTGHPHIMDQLREFDANQATMNRPAWHWTTEDFKPIHKAFDEMFEKAGLRSKGGPAQPRYEVGGRFSPARHVSPESTVGRELRAKRHVEEALQLAGVSRLERFGQSKPAQMYNTAKGYVSQGYYDQPSLINRRRTKRLSAAEQKATQIVSSDVPASGHIEYHGNKITQLHAARDQLDQLHDQALHSNVPLQVIDQLVRQRQALRVDIRHHQRQQGLARMAARHLENPSARLTSAINETRNVIRQRESALQIPGARAAHRVGKHAYEIESGAAGVESPIVTVERLERNAARLRKRLDNTVDSDVRQALEQRIAQLEDEAKQWHDKFTKRGLEAIDRGGFYLPQQRLVRQRKMPFASRPGPYGKGPPQKLPEMRHPYRGLLQRSGNFRTDATGLAAESYRRAQAYATLERAHRQLLAAAHSTPEAAGPFRMPIREKYTVPQRLREAILKADQGTLTPREMEGISTQELESVVTDMFPHWREGESTNIPGVKWIDGRLLGGIRGSVGGPRGAGLEAIDAINNLGRASLLYTKPAYALNLLQALGANVVQQGVFAPLNLQRALTLGRDLSIEDQQILLSLVGQGLSRSFEADTGLGKAAIHGAGEVWNAGIDRYPRLASLLHEMRREGFNTPAKIHALLHDERMRDKLVEVTRRANREAVEYGELTPWERSVAKRFLFFYPWIRGATAYSLRFPREHPIQAAAYYQQGEQGHERSTKAFGPFVDYAPGMAGEIPIGDKQGINLSTLSTPQTLTDFAHALYNPAELPRFFGPAAAATYTAISGKTPLDVELPTNVNRYTAAAEQLTGLSPVYRWLRGSGSSYTGEKPIDQPLQPRNFVARTKRFVGGRAIPQDVNKPAVEAKGESTYLEHLTGEERARYRSDKEQRQARVDAASLYKKGIIPSPTLSPLVQRAYKLKAQRALAIAQFASAHHTPQKRIHAADKTDIMLKIISAAKTAPPAVIAGFRHYVSTLEDPQDIAKANDRFWRYYGGGGVLSAWARVVNANA